MGVACKPLTTGWRRKGQSTAVRVAGLRSRLEVEQDPRLRASIAAQLSALTRQPVDP